MQTYHGLTYHDITRGLSYAVIVRLVSTIPDYSDETDKKKGHKKAEKTIDDLIDEEF